MEPDFLGTEMKMPRIISIAAVVLFVLAFWPGTASARSRLYVGFGTSFGHGHSTLLHHSYPDYRWHSGYYTWLDHDRYLWMDRGRYYGSFWGCPAQATAGWPSCWPGTSIWVEDYWPTYVSPPVVVERPHIVTRQYVVVRPKGGEVSPADARLFAEVRNKKGELLWTLKIGDKASRTRAITDLAGYSFDDTVREALEEIILKDPDPELRKCVAESLGNVKNKNVIPTLEKVRLEDSNEEVRREADRAISQITSP